MESSVNDNQRQHDKFAEDSNANTRIETEKQSNDLKRKKRRPKSQRNRKRPCSIHEAEPVIHSKIVRLSFPAVNHDGSLAASNKEIPNAPLIRIIEPYPYTFTSFAKARWVGKTVFDIYTKEFGSYPPSYYQLAIEQGRILVSNNKVDLSYQIQGKDILSHTVHRHEPAVAVSSMDPNMPISIAAETGELLAVDKPATMPVHPCGGYHQNSLMEILSSVVKGKGKGDVDDDDDCEIESNKDTTIQQKAAFDKLYTIHRLDRLTSGLVILAKTSQVAKEWGVAIQERESSEKLYLARVRGKFGSNVPSNIPNLISSDSHDGKNIPKYGEWIAANSSLNDLNIDQEKSNRKHAKGGTAIDYHHEVEVSRQRNAHGYWITDHEGKMCKEMNLETYSKIEHSIDDWLNILKNTHKKNNNTGESLTATSTKNDKPFLWLHLACPVRIEQPKIGICSASTFDDLEDELYHKTVKSAQTAFAVIQYNSQDDSTLLLVRPATGRTHQIRIHLQYLQHPIANDPNYGGKLWFGNADGEAACEEAQRLLDVANCSNDGDPKTDGDEITTHQSRIISDEPATEQEVKLMADLGARDPQKEGESVHDYVKRTCVWCARMKGHEEERAHLEFLVRSPGLWLHAFQYTVKGVSFRTELPQWSK